MQRSELQALLRGVRGGQVAPALAARRILESPLESLEFATLDHQRTLRVGFPEVVLAQGKTADQVVAIVRRIYRRSRFALVTRADAVTRQALIRAFPRCEAHERARMVVLRRDAARPRGNVLVVSAGTADLPVAEEAMVTAQCLGSRARLVADVGVAGLHRLLAHRRRLRGARVIVVVAGLEGALPSVVGGLVDRPVIAVPTSIGYGAHFRGLAPLLAMLNSCAAGVMVVNVDNGFGAGYAAHLINILPGH